MQLLCKKKELEGSKERKKGKERISPSRTRGRNEERLISSAGLLLSLSAFSQSHKSLDEDVNEYLSVLPGLHFAARVNYAAGALLF